MRANKTNGNSRACNPRKSQTNNLQITIIAINRESNKYDNRDDVQQSQYGKRQTATQIRHGGLRHGTARQRQCAWHGTAVTAVRINMHTDAFAYGFFGHHHGRYGTVCTHQRIYNIIDSTRIIATTIIAYDMRPQLYAMCAISRTRAHPDTVPTTTCATRRYGHATSHGTSACATMIQIHHTRSVARAYASSTAHRARLTVVRPRRDTRAPRARRPRA